MSRSSALRGVALTYLTFGPSISSIASEAVAPVRGVSVRSPNVGTGRAFSLQEKIACPWATRGVRESVSRGSVPLFLTKGGQLLDSWAHRPVRVHPKRESSVRSASFALDLAATKGFPRPSSERFRAPGPRTNSSARRAVAPQQERRFAKTRDAHAGSDLVS